MRTIIIVAMTPDRVIGKDGRLPWHVPGDLKFFKRTTTGHAVIMGRKTFESIGKPLPDRRNIVMTRGEGPADASATASIDVVRSLEQALALCRERSEQKAFVIGGGQIYALALPVADEMIVTHIDEPTAAGDTYFPVWNQHEWQCTGAVDEAFPLAIRYVRQASQEDGRNHSRENT